jgi:hypothetical protein
VKVISAILETATFCPWLEENAPEIISAVIVTMSFLGIAPPRLKFWLDSSKKIVNDDQKMRRRKGDLLWGEI